MGREVPYQKGLAQGEARAWFESGVLALVETFAEGRRHGPWKQFHESGPLRLEGEYREDARDGPWTTYAPSGAVIVRVTYREGERVVPVARAIEEPRLRLRLGVPEGFEEYPLGKLGPGALHAFIHPVCGEPRDGLVIILAHLDNPLPRGATRAGTMERELRKFLRSGAADRFASQAYGERVQTGDPEVDVRAVQWNSLTIPVADQKMAFFDVPYSIRTVPLPMGNDTLVVTVGGETSRQETVRALSDELLASLEGRFAYAEQPLFEGWSAERIARLASGIASLTGIVALVV